jgi:hypothetical protein
VGAAQATRCRRVSAACDQDRRVIAGLGTGTTVAELGDMKLLIAVLFAASPAFADATSEENGYLEETRKQVQQYADLANKACDSAITFELDRASFAGAFNSKGKTGLDVLRLDAITEPFRAIRYVCLEGKAQAAGIKHKISSVRLGFASGSPTHAVARGTLVVHVPKSGDKRSWAGELKSFLKKL